MLTGTSITFGLVGVSLLGAYILRIERYLAMQSIYLALNGHVIVYADGGLDHSISKPGKYSLDPAAQKFLTEAGQDARVAKVSPLLKANGLLHNGCLSFPFAATAAPAETVAWARSQSDVARYVPELAKVEKGLGYWEAPASENPFTISPRLALIMGKEKIKGEKGAHENSNVYDCSKPADRLALRSDPSVQLIGAGFEGGMALSDGVISGLASSGMAFQDDTALQMGYAQAQAAYQTDRATAITYYLKKEGDIRSFIRDLNKKIKAAGLKFDVYPFSSEKISAFYVGGMEFNWVMLYLFLALVCTVVAISISNSLYISLMERKAEFGTLLSLGFRKSQIVYLIIMEHSFLLAASLVPGIALIFVARALVHASNVRILIPGLANDVQFRLNLTVGFECIVVTIMLALVLLVARAGTKHFLRRPILDLLGS